MIASLLTTLNLLCFLSIYSKSSNQFGQIVSWTNSHPTTGISHAKSDEGQEEVKSESIYSKITKNNLKTDSLPDNETPIVSLPTLNIFENVTFWAELEEVLFKSIKSRQLMLQRKIWLLEEYISLYKIISGITTKYSTPCQNQPNAQSGFYVPKEMAFSQPDRSYHMLQFLKEIIKSEYIDTGLHEILFGKTPLNLKKIVSEYPRLSGSHNLPEWPNWIDLEFAMHSLILIKEVYNFDFKDLPSALSPETIKPPQLNAFQCMEIGSLALQIQHYAAAIEWMEHGLEKVSQSKDYSITRAILESNLEVAIEMHNDMLVAAKRPKGFTAEHLFDEFVSLSPRPSVKRQRLPSSIIKGKDELEAARLAALSELNAMCTGKHDWAAHKSAALYCWYDTSSSPARTILPFKKELLSLDPEVIQVYDFLGDKLISKLLIHKTNCSWTTHTLSMKSYTEMLSSRTSSVCWLEEPELESVLRKVSSLSLADLRADGSYGPVNLNNYVFGRFHTVHLDALQLNLDKLRGSRFEEKLKNIGDRFITFLFYFNDVPAGGLTVFAEEGASAMPVKGSVVVWKNLYRNGSARNDMWHGGCPVIYGHKLGGILQIHYNSQFLTYPCTLNRNE